MKSIRTMRRFFTAFRMTIWMFLPMLVALAGCEPEPLPVSFGVESGGQEVTTFDFGVMSYEGPSTKAYATDVEDGLPHAELTIGSEDRFTVSSEVKAALAVRLHQIGTHDADEPVLGLRLKPQGKHEREYYR